MNLDEIVLSAGFHYERSTRLCVMEAVAYIAGESHSDHPGCVSVPITGFMISWNDLLPTDQDRERLLKPLIPYLIGTRTGTADDTARAWLAFDWIARTVLPAWLSCVPSLAGHAEVLRALPEIQGETSLEAGRSSLLNAHNAAATTVGVLSTWDSGYKRVEHSIRITAGMAAIHATTLVTQPLRAARYSAMARDILFVIVAVAVKSGANLVPTIAALQESAQDLVIRMCAIRSKGGEE